MVDKSGFVDCGTLNEGDEVGTLYVDVSAIVHTHTKRAIIYNDNSIVNVSDGMQVTLLNFAVRSASSVELLGARTS